MNWLFQISISVVGALLVEVFSTNVCLANINFQALDLEQTSPKNQVFPNTQEKIVLSPEQLKKKAQSITVKIISGQTWGSGIIIFKQKNIYTVVTNHHVLIFSQDKSYRIQTPDGQIYQANLLETVDFEDKDLGLVQFRSEKEYGVISLSSMPTLSEGKEVFAAGFPVEIDNQEIKEFYFTNGNVAQFSKKAFGGGYQIGYTNDIQKGMSGGPLLNVWGEVVAINGMHKYPLWGNPYVFSDGSLASEARQKEMSKLSWAIPINTFLKLAPQFSPLEN
jgi:serine protease Do